jgi:hypothetical protein
MKRLSIALIAIATTSVSQATIITYSGLGFLNGQALAGIGTNAGAPGTGYIQGNGWTPNIAVATETRNLDGSLAYPNLAYWDQNYGDLTDVGYAVTNGTMARVILTADSGSLVRLNSFDLAGYFRADLGVARLQVKDGTGAILFNQDGTTVSGAGGTHSSYAPALQAQQLIIEWGTNWNVGIDNINFDQVSAVPEPASMVALTVGGLALLRRRKSK